MNTLTPEAIDAIQSIEIKLRCPACDRKVRPAALVILATIGAHRTCSNGHSYRVTIKPLEVTRARALHELTWTPAEQSALDEVLS